MNCGNNASASNNRTAVTHIDNELKSGPISLMWIAPSHETLDCRRVEFWATVVRNYSTFWTGIKSQPYQVDDDTPGGGEVANANQLLQICKKSRRIGCVIPRRYNAKWGETKQQPSRAR